MVPRAPVPKSTVLSQTPTPDVKYYLLLDTITFVEKVFSYKITTEKRIRKQKFSGTLMNKEEHAA